MRALHDLRQILKTIARDVEVLPVVGGAVEDLEHPDLGKREDQALNEEERVLDVRTTTWHPGSTRALR